MLTRYEARKLQRDMQRELDATPVAVLKCAAGLLIVVGLALVGAVTDLQHDGSVPVTTVMHTQQSSGLVAAHVQNGDAR